jgi:ribosomal protein S18 acetylase RimI-like enzyme
VAAIRFYRKLGFTIDSFDLSFYSNEDLAKGEIVLFMRRYLSA